jgi:anti-sigma factor RsiW
MTCRKVLSLLSEHVDGKLSGRVTWEVDRHLATCHACTGVANELRKVVAVVSASPRVDAPPDFGARVRDRLTAASAARPQRSYWSAPPLASALRRAPAWATAGIAGVLMLTAVLRGPVPSRNTMVRPSVEAGEVVALHPAGDQHVALTASGPLDDVSASVLTATYGQDYD